MKCLVVGTLDCPFSHCSLAPEAAAGAPEATQAAAAEDAAEWVFEPFSLGAKTLCNGGAVAEAVARLGGGGEAIAPGMPR